MFKTKQKEEARKRMELLKLNKNVIREFEEEDKLNLSESNFGLLYWLNEEQEEMVKKFEEESGGLAYHLIHNLTTFGELYSIFYVSKHEEEWQYDYDDLQENIAFVYVKNVDDELSSEYGSIGFKNMNSGLIRTA